MRTPDSERAARVAPKKHAGVYKEQIEPEPVDLLSTLTAVMIHRADFAQPGTVAEGSNDL